MPKSKVQSNWNTEPRHATVQTQETPTKTTNKPNIKHRHTHPCCATHPNPENKTEKNLTPKDFPTF